MSKNFESFREFLDSLCFTFSAICLSETWCQPHETSNSNLQIPGYVSLHQTRKNRREGGLCIFLIESLSYKVRDDLAVNSSAIEYLCVEVFNGPYIKNVGGRGAGGYGAEDFCGVHEIF